MSLPNIRETYLALRRKNASISSRKLQEFYFDMDVRITRYLSAAGCSKAFIASVLATNPVLQRFTEENQKAYIERCLKYHVANLASSSSGLLVKLRKLWEKNYTPTQIYAEAQGVFRQEYTLFFRDTDIQLAEQLLEKGYLLVDIQQTIAKESYFAKSFALVSPQILDAYCQNVLHETKRIGSGKLYELARACYLQKMEQSKDKYQEYALSNYIESKIIIAMMQEHHHLPEVLEKVLLRDSHIRRTDKERQSFIAACTAVRDRYWGIQSVSEHAGSASPKIIYQQAARRYMEAAHKVLLNRGDDKQIAARLLQDGHSLTLVESALRFGSPLIVQPGRKSAAYLEGVLASGRAIYEKLQQNKEEIYQEVARQYKAIVERHDGTLKKRGYRGVNFNRTYFDGVAVFELFQARLPRPVIETVLNTLSPVAKKGDFDRASYGSYICQCVDHVMEREEKIRAFRWPENVPSLGPSYLELHAMGVNADEFYYQAIQERIEKYPYSSVNLHREYIDKDCAEKLLYRYADMPHQMLEIILRDHSPHAAMPGVALDYPHQILEEVLENNETLQKREANQKLATKEYLEACELASAGVTKDENNMLFYHSGQAALHMLQQGYTVPSVKVAIIDGLKQMHMGTENAAQYAETVMQGVHNVLERQQIIQDSEALAETNTDRYLRYMQAQFVTTHHLTSSTDVSAAVELFLSSETNEAEMKALIRDYSPVACEPGRNERYPDFIVNSAALHIQEEHQKLDHYQVIPSFFLDKPPSVTNEYRYQKKALLSRIHLPFERKMDVVLATGLLSNGYPEIEVAASIFGLSPLANRSETYATEIVREAKLRVISAKHHLQPSLDDSFGLSRKITSIA